MNGKKFINQRCGLYKCYKCDLHFIERNDIIKHHECICGTFQFTTLQCQICHNRFKREEYRQHMLYHLMNRGDTIERMKRNYSNDIYWLEPKDINKFIRKKIKAIFIQDLGRDPIL